MRIVLLGAPGSGKGTQAKLLVDKYKIPHISTGDILRAAVSAGSDLGKKAKAVMDAGQLVSDEIVLGLIQERMGQADAKNGFIMDGFPRNIPQAQALDAMLARLGRPLQLAVLVDVANDVLLKRITGRRTCASSKCGATYNIYFSPSKVAGKCDKCGSTLQHRSDDNEATVRNRLQVYQQQTQPLVAYYRAQGKLRTVKGVGSINEIFKSLSDIVEAQIRPLAEVMHKIEEEEAAKAAKAAAAKAAAKQAAKDAAKAIAAAARAKAQAQKAAEKAAKKAAAAKASKKPAPAKPVKAAKAAPKPAARKAVPKKAPKKPTAAAKKVSKGSAKVKAKAKAKKTK
jgi:adenylate kinase